MYMRAIDEYVSNDKQGTVKCSVLPGLVLQDPQQEPLAQPERSMLARPNNRMCINPWAPGGVPHFP